MHLYIGIYTKTFELTYRNYVPDPIYGAIEIPDWLVRISKEKSIRRMMFIRQLGLKAYIDYPGAIHTRYSHVMGVMNLSGRIVNLLYEYEKNRGHKEIASALKNNRINVMAAGFFHDIGHGPFSHVIDYILKRYSKMTHEQVSLSILDNLKDIENDGINIKKVEEMINGKHPYKFINHIMNGPIDADKLDYLLRDAYHVGLRYSLDLEHFITNFRVLGLEASSLTDFELGLEDNLESLATGEIFIVIWKNMYELVYYVTSSRIAEKMIEKAVILKIDEDNQFKSYFSDIAKFIELDDENLFSLLSDGRGMSSKLTRSVRENDLYLLGYEQELGSEMESSIMFANSIDKDSDDTADRLSELLCSKLKCEKYELICDIIKSRMPKPIHLNKFLGSDPIELRSKSDVVDSIKERVKIRVYLHKSLQQNFDKSSINQYLIESISSW